MSVNGLVFDLARFSLHDGPGIRTVVFLKGCPLRCVWCHNPESYAVRPELLFSAEKCINCGECFKVCPKQAHRAEQQSHEFRRELCIACGKCTSRCFSGALVLAGKSRSSSSVLEEAAQDADYYGKDGGITLSGGEPLLQPDFSAAVLQGAKDRGWTTAIETCGMAQRHVLERMLPIIDYWLFDIKAVDAGKHQKFTGLDNEKIHDNLHFLDDQGAHIELRCPLIPGLNDSDADLAGIRELAYSLQHRPDIHIEPFHPFGKGKFAQLGLLPPENVPVPEEKDIQRWKNFLL